MRRVAMKTATYSAMHMCVAITVAYAMSGSWAVALGIGIVEPLVQTVAYNFHEWGWSKAGVPAETDSGASLMQGHPA